MEIESTYRYKWYHNLENVNKTLVESPFNCTEYKELLTQYVDLTKQALEEIKNLENTNKDLEAANWGLDCSQLFMSRLVEYGLNFIDKENMAKLLNEIQDSLGSS